MSLMKPLEQYGQRTGSMWMVIFLCVCVLVQMLGLPVTLLNLFTPSDLLTESMCEDPSVLPSLPELRPSSALCHRIDGHPTLHFPVFVTSVFHPPLI